MDNSSEAADMEFPLFNVSEIEFMDNVNDIMLENYQNNETAANFSKEINSDDPAFSEASNMPKAPVDVEVGRQSPLIRDDEPQLDQMKANPVDTFGFGNAQVDQLVSSPGRTNGSFLQQSSSNPNLGQQAYSGFEGNGSSLGHDNEYQTSSPLFSPLIMEPMHSFPLSLAEIFPQDEDYLTPSFNSKPEVNSVQTDQANGHIGPVTLLPQNGGYSTQSFQSKHGSNSVQTNHVDGHIGLVENLPQNGGYSTQPFHSKDAVNSIQTNQVNGNIELVEKLPQNEGYSIQPFHSEHGVSSVQTNQVNSHIGPAKNLSQNESYPIQPFDSEHVINSIQTNQVNDHIGLVEELSQNEGFSTQASHSHVVNSVQTNQVKGHIGSSLQAELLGSQRIESSNLGKTITLADQSQQNNGNTFSDNHQALPYPNSLTQSSSGIGYLHGGSTQIKQRAQTWVSNNENAFYRPLAPLGQQFIQSPRPSASVRAQQLNSPRQLLNQVPNMPNASNSLLQSMSTEHSMPLQHLPRRFSDQRDQVAVAPRAYNPQTYSTRLPESSVPLRTAIRPLPQINPLGLSDSQYLNSLQSKATMLPSKQFMLDDSNEQRHHQFDPFSPMRNQFGTHGSNSILQEALMHSGSYRLPAHPLASSQFSIMSGLHNSDHHNPMLTESSLLPRLQQQERLQNQTARPFATNPTSGTSLSSTILNSLLLKEPGDTSAPHQMETSLRDHRERGSSGRRRGHSRRRNELGESSSSPFRRFRRDSTLPQAFSRNSPFLHNEAGTSSTAGSPFGPRPIKNAVYDPKYEMIGLPIDPHLRLFATI